MGFEDTTNCKKCGVGIKFIKTPKGAYMPVDLRLIRLVTKEGGTTEGYMSHFATCPNAEEFRKL